MSESGGGVQKPPFTDVQNMLLEIRAGEKGMTLKHETPGTNRIEIIGNPVLSKKIAELEEQVRVLREAMNKICNITSFDSWAYEIAEEALRAVGAK